MRNSIKNHNIKSRADLQKRQDAIQDDYKDLEKDILNSILNPISIASLAYSFISSKKVKKRESQKIWDAPSSKEMTQKKSKLKPILKSIGVSFLRWQAFNLAFFLGKKAIQKLKHLKKE